MIVDNGGDASHEGQAGRHVEVKMERLAEPAKNKQETPEQNSGGRHSSALFGLHSTMFGITRRASARSA